MNNALDCHKGSGHSRGAHLGSTGGLLTSPATSILSQGRRAGPGRKRDVAPGEEAEGAQLLGPEVWVQNSATRKGLDSHILRSGKEHTRRARRCPRPVRSLRISLREASTLLVTAFPGGHCGREGVSAGISSSQSGSRVPALNLLRFAAHSPDFVSY